ncbi:MAG: hypothetical protein LBJ59_04130 [Zoogloeaceae bacterium]|jgi:hypothetical protein|nr:hypothetical protein [Zoogloeaceae bacterium]
MEIKNEKYAEIIKPIRNRLREFDYHSVIFALSSYLSCSHNDQYSYKHMERLPWNAETLALWVLSDNARCYKQKIMNANDVRVYIEDIRLILDKLPSDNKDTALSMRQLFMQQIPYQKTANFYAFVRQLLLLNKVVNGSKLENVIERFFEMSIEQYSELATIFYLYFGQRNSKIIFRDKLVGDIVKIYGKTTINGFISKIAPSLDAARKIVRDKRKICLDECFQPTVLYEAPCISVSDQIISWGIPTIRRYFEYVVSDCLEDSSEVNIRQDWDALFSNYIGEVLKHTGCIVLNEEEIKNKFKLNGKVCDFLLEEKEGFVLIEVKHKNLTKQIPAIAEPSLLRSKLKATLCKAFGQLENTEKYIKDDSSYQGKNIVSIIVTPSELWLGPARFFDAYSNDVSTYIISADALERLCELSRLHGISFCSYFKDVEKQNSDPKTALFSPEWLLMDKQYELNRIEHLDVFFDRIFGKIRNHFMLNRLKLANAVDQNCA